MANRVLGFINRYTSAAVYSAYLFTLGIRLAEHREFLETIRAHFRPARNTGSMPLPVLVPEAELKDLVPENIPVEIREPMVVNGNVSLLEILTIARLVRFFRPARLFEIGTFDGRTTLNMAANSDPDACVFTLDLPAAGLGRTLLPIEEADAAYIAKPESGIRFRGQDCANRIVQLYGDSASFDFSPFANSIDFVFVDGSHTFDYVMNDSRQALRLLRNREGIILWHDYGTPYWEGVTRALNELYMNVEPCKGLVHIRGTSLVCLGSTVIPDGAG